MFRHLPPQAETPERISHRYHLIRVVVTLSAIGVITLLIGLSGLVDPDNVHPLRYFGGCLVVVAVCGLAVTYLTRGGAESTNSVEAAMLAGLFATCLNTIYGGVIEVDPWWQVCGYLVVILISGGVALRRWPTFVFFIVVALAAWTIAIGTSGVSGDFLVDSYLLILLGAVFAATVLWLFRIERRRVTELNRELQENASYDPLTGVLNRHGLLREILRNDATRGRAWCAYVDIDHFKSINDRRGHDHGDQVLRESARSLAGAGGDLTARWGGDEFVTLGFGLPPDEAAIQARIIREIHDVDPGTTVTVGISRGQLNEGTELGGLLRRADRRMYERRGVDRDENRSATA